MPIQASAAEYTIMLQELVTYSKLVIFTLFIRPFISEAPLALGEHVVRALPLCTLY